MRTVSIHDTLSGALRPIEPRDGSRESGRVGIYTCGPTVYSRIHIGNARPFVIFMLLRRFLADQGYQPTLVINITDVNDKIYDAARNAGKPSAELAAEMTAAYIADTDRLGLGRPDAEPLATETIEPIIDLISELIAGGHAYESGGDVYFAVRSFDGYGKLSNRDPGEMDQGEEAGSAELKRDPLDFALWKTRKQGEDASWESPWGPGRPGWHIECSAMAEATLGSNFAIHGGGSDLVFPHHENEIAQSEAARRVPLARIWMHNGMVQAQGDAAKMSKSARNIFQLSVALDRFGAPAVVTYLTSGHYRQPLAFSPEALEQAAARVERIRNFLQGGGATSTVGPGGSNGGSGEAAPPPPFVNERREAFLEALADDFNTPRAFASLFEIVAEGNRRELPGGHRAVAELLPLLGLESLLTEEGRTLTAGTETDSAQPLSVDEAEAVRMLEDREQARAEKDFERADAIRNQLAAAGWEVRDGAAGVTLVRRGPGDSVG